LTIGRTVAFGGNLGRILGRISRLAPAFAAG
jgi:hypothetical protein